MWREETKFFLKQESSWSSKSHHTVEDIDIDDPETKKEAFLSNIEVKADILEILVFLKLEQDEKKVCIGFEI